MNDNKYPFPTSDWLKTLSDAISPIAKMMEENQRLMLPTVNALQKMLVQHDKAMKRAFDTTLIESSALRVNNLLSPVSSYIEAINVPLSNIFANLPDLSSIPFDEYLDENFEDIDIDKPPLEIVADAEIDIQKAKEKTLENPEQRVREWIVVLATVISMIFTVLSYYQKPSEENQRIADSLERIADAQEEQKISLVNDVEVAEDLILFIRGFYENAHEYNDESSDIELESEKPMTE